MFSTQVRQLLEHNVYKIYLPSKSIVSSKSTDLNLFYKEYHISTTFYYKSHFDDTKSFLSRIL